MKTKKLLQGSLKLAVLLACMGQVTVMHAAVALAPLFAISPNQTNISLATGASTVVTYSITNNSSFPLTIKSIVPTVNNSSIAVASKTTNNCRTLLSHGNCSESISLKVKNILSTFTLDLTVMSTLGEGSTTTGANQVSGVVVKPSPPSPPTYSAYTNAARTQPQ
jgi:hypothetical protein